MALSSTNSAYHISSLLDKMASSDKDFRFMATNDLLQELHKDSLKMDEDSERRVVRMLLTRLEDQVGEVQNLAVKCLGPLVLKVKESQTEHILEALCKLLVNSEDAILRDVAALSLKSVIGEIPHTMTPLQNLVCKLVTPQLLHAIEAVIEDANVKMECLEILADLLLKFGHSSHMISHHENIMRVCVAQLSSSRLAVRKKSIVTLSNLILCCSSTLFAQLMTHFKDLFQNYQSPDIEDLKTSIQAIASISKHGKQKISSFLPTFIPLMITFCHSKNHDDDELAETCLSAIEVCVRFCPKESFQFHTEYIGLCLELLKYDPNYTYDDEELDMDDGEYASDAESEGGYSDDDDLSWRVRRAAAKCLQAVIQNYLELLSEFYSTVAPALIARLIEREENVKTEIFHAFNSLLLQTKNVTSRITENSMDEDSSPCYQLIKLVPLLIQNLQKALKSRSVKTRSGAFHILRELCLVLPGSLNEHISLIVPGLEYSIREKNSANNNLKIDAFSFLCALLSTHEPEYFHSQLNLLVDLTILGVQDSFYRTSSESLLVAQKLAKVVRPFDATSKIQTVNYSPMVSKLYPVILYQLKSVELDQEVKEKSISAMAAILYHLADSLKSELVDCLKILRDRMQNEITRLAAVKAIDTIAQTPLEISLSCVLDESVQIMAQLLRKNQRSLRIHILLCLQTLWKRFSTEIGDEEADCVLAQLPPMINDVENDLTSCQYSLAVACLILNERGTRVANVVSGKLLPVATDLVFNVHTHGLVLDALVQFFGALVRSGGWTASTLLSKLIQNEHSARLFGSPLSGAIRNEFFFNLSRSCAEITIACNDNSLIQNWVTLIKNPSESEPKRFLALLTLGDIGKFHDLSSFADIKMLLSEAFKSPAEEWRICAAISLGKISLGNLSYFIPYILKQIESSAGDKFFLLHSVKEIISHVANANRALKIFDLLRPHLEPIWGLLEQSCQLVEEGSRNLVSESLGRLCLLDCHSLLPRLEKMLVTNSPLVLATVLTAIKYCFISQSHPIDDLIRQILPKVTEALYHEDLSVRRAALVTINSAAHNKNSLIKNDLDSILPAIYKETKINQALIKTVQMGPFSHTEDLGLDLRKVAYECLYTLTEDCLDKIDLFTFIQHIECGLRDVADIKLLCYLMIEKLCLRSPGAVIHSSENLLAPIRTTLTEKAKDKSVRAELDKLGELKRASMRVFICISRLAQSKTVNDTLQVIMNDKGTVSSSASNSSPPVPLMPCLYQLYTEVEKELQHER